MIHRAKKVDANHAEVVQALEAIGACVIDLSGAGRGVMDILVSYRHKWHAIEIKDGAKSPSRQSLTPAQIELHAKVAATGNEIHIARTVGEALRIVLGQI